MFDIVVLRNTEGVFINISSFKGAGFYFKYWSHTVKGQGQEEKRWK